MSDIAILKEMINKTATVPLEEEQHGTHLNYLIKLTEKNSYALTVYGMPNNDESIVIKADCFKAPSSVFAGSKNECRRADFVIIANTAIEGKIIVCIEMKKTKDSSKTIIEQLNGAKCFVAYCQEIGKAFWKKPDFLDAYQYRFVSIGHIPISKRKTRAEKRVFAKRQSGIHSHPDQMLKITSSNNVQFNYLIEG